MREATEEEKAQLTHFVGAKYGAEVAEDIVSQAYIAVFPDYVTGGPGFFGKVMIVLYDGGPEQVETYIWREGKMEQVTPTSPEE